MLHLIGRFQRRLEETSHVITVWQMGCNFLVLSSWGCAPSPSLFPAVAGFHWALWWPCIFDLRTFWDCFYFDGRNFRTEISFWRGRGRRWRYASLPKGYQRFRSSPLGRYFLATISSFLVTAVFSAGSAHLVSNPALNKLGSIYKIRTPAMGEVWAL